MNANKYVEDHLSKDTLDGEVDFYHKSLFNDNARVGSVAHRFDDENYAEFKAGVATTYPTFNEAISDRKPIQELTTYEIFDIGENTKTKEQAILHAVSKIVFPNGTSPEQMAEMIRVVSNRTALSWDKLEFIRKRQSITLDVINPTSQAFHLFGEVHNEVSPANFDGTTYSLTTRGLSVFESIKLSMEGVIVTERNGTLVAILDTNKMPDDVDGFIKFDLNEYTNNSTEKIITIKFNLSQKTVDGYVYSVVNDSFMVSEIIEDINDSSALHIQQFESDIPIELNGSVIMSGARTVLNKTTSGMIAEKENGEKVYLPPYGIIDASGILRVTTLKDYTFFMSSDDISTDADSLFQRTVLSYSDGRFIDALDLNEHSFISNGQVVTREYRLGDKVGFFGFSVRRGGFSPTESVIETGFSGSEGPSHALVLSRGTATRYMYEHNEEMYIKNPSDTSYTRLNFLYQTIELSSEDIVTGLIALFDGEIYFQQNESMYGQVFRNKRFLYEVDYSVVGGVLSSEPMYGLVYPVDFFRVKRMIGACKLSKGDDFPFASYDNINNTENKYNAAQVSRVLSDESGQIALINAQKSTKDIIETRYKTVFSLTNDIPAEIVDFGVISYTSGDRRAHPSEHWLSKKMRLSDDESSRMSYCGTSEKEDPSYGMFWVVFRDSNTEQEVLLSEREYSLEIRDHTEESRWMKQKLDCDTTLKDPIAKIGRDTNPNIYYMRVFLLDSHLILDSGSVFRFKNTGNSYSATSAGDNLYVNLDPSINGFNFGVNKVSMYFVNNQISSVLTTTTFLSGGPTKQFPFYKDEVFIYSIPEIGFVHATSQNVDWIDDFTVTEIRDINKRGVLYEGGEISVSAFFEFFPLDNELKAYYEIVGGDLDSIEEIEMPEWFSGSVYESDKDDLFPRRILPYPPEEDEHAVDTLGELRSIPMILANKIHKDFGHTQCTIASWDESVNGILLPEEITTREEESTMGYELIVEKNGTRPTYIHDIVPVVNYHNGNTPYSISRDMILRVSDSALIKDTDWGVGYHDQIDAAEADGNDILANELVMRMLGENFNEKLSNTTVLISPVHYMQQDPWKNAIDYSTPLDKIMIGDRLVFTIQKGQRLFIDLKAGVRNKITLSHPMRLFDENYYKIDGIVNKEMISDASESQYIDSGDTYALEYKNFYSGMFFMKRKVVVDMKMYPNRRAYQENNLLRELAAPIREDAHHKKMEGRSVYAEWDLRYITDSLHSYSEKVYELPTSFTCDSLPEEAILSRDHKNYLGLYKEELSVILGVDLIHYRGSISGSVSNTSDEDIEFSIDYLNHNNQAGQDVSYPVNEPLFLYRKDKIWSSREYNGKRNRVKTGIKLVGTTINGG